MQEDLEEPWGQLVSTEMPPGVEEERVPILGKTFLIGRYKGQWIAANTFAIIHVFPSHLVSRCGACDIWQQFCVDTALSAAEG